MTKRLSLTWCMLAFGTTVCAQNLRSVQDRIGKLSISVDARIELLGAAQLISEYPLCTENSPYSNQVKRFFDPFAESDACTCTQNLLKLGFAFDAPPAMMLRYSSSPELTQQKPYSDYLDVRAKGKSNLERYRKALSEFAIASRFSEFWTENQAFYRQLIDVFKREMGEVDVISLLENYYGGNGENFHVILSPLSGYCNYSASVPNAAGSNDIYALLGMPEVENGVPVVDKNEYLDLMIHEFSHSFVGAIADKYSDKIMSFSHLYEPIKVQMTKQAYGDWPNCVEEHIVRAVVIRILDRMGNSEYTKAQLQRQQRENFSYIVPLIEQLKEYEAKRDAEGISFADYMPTLLDVFNELKPYCGIGDIFLMIRFSPPKFI